MNEMTAGLLQNAEQTVHVVQVHLHHGFQQRTPLREISRTPKQRNGLVRFEKFAAGGRYAALVAVSELQCSHTAVAKMVEQLPKDRLAPRRRDVLKNDQRI